MGARCCERRHRPAERAWRELREAPTARGIKGQGRALVGALCAREARRGAAGEGDESVRRGKTLSQSPGGGSPTPPVRLVPPREDGPAPARLTRAGVVVAFAQVGQIRRPALTAGRRRGQSGSRCGQRWRTERERWRLRRQRERWHWDDGVWRLLRRAAAMLTLETVQYAGGGCTAA